MRNFKLLLVFVAVFATLQASALSRDCNLTVKVVAAKGWKVASIGIWPSSNEYPDFNKWSGGGYKGTRTLKAKLPGEGSYCVSVDMYNPKWDSVINVQYFVYY